MADRLLHAGEVPGRLPRPTAHERVARREAGEHLARVQRGPDGRLAQLHEGRTRLLGLIDQLEVARLRLGRFALGIGHEALAVLVHELDALGEHALRRL